MRCWIGFQTMILMLGINLAFGMPAEADVRDNPAATGVVRERLSIDRGWRFALGHATDPAKDFGFGTRAFFFAKAGYGDGPAATKFDDRGWRPIDLPHDWAVELPFNPKGSQSHGFREVGPGYPEHDIGWYRRALDLGPGDRGRRIAIEFDGVFRDASVWFNGHYIGEEHSGYSSFRFDVTDYVDYNGPNELVVRVDASREEGWFYEGAGIYRHVWLTKTAPLHVAHWGTFVTSDVRDAAATTVTVQTRIENEDKALRDFTVEQEITDAAGQQVVTSAGQQHRLLPGETSKIADMLVVPQPKLWSLETPYLYRLTTIVRSGGRVVDRYDTPFGIRTIRWDAQTGFWLNGRHVVLRGTNNHQDHAGLGVALPDALQAYRLEQLKALGSNAYRTAHGPPTPELLDAADRLGMLVLDEHRMMGSTPELRDQLDRLIERDRNHPSVFLWSVGNEEWALEGNDLGARLTALMQAEVRRLDPTRPATVAISGGDPRGSAVSSQILGLNYRRQHDVDADHRIFPDKPIVMTEESAFRTTRGIYDDDPAKVAIAAYDKPPLASYQSNIEDGWRAVVERPWIAGVFFWTGFDYRGEPNPFGWPSTISQSGMLDLAGFVKDNGWYIRSQWQTAPVVHILPHWNWPGREGKPVPVWVYTNGDEVLLKLNGRSLGRKPIAQTGHAEWSVDFAPGTLTALAYRDGKLLATDRVETTGSPQKVRLSGQALPDGPDGRHVMVVTVNVLDAHGRVVPTADADVTFAATGAVRLLGVGNGDPGSHEPDQFLPSYVAHAVNGWRIAPFSGHLTASGPAASEALAWRDPFRWYPPGTEPATPEAFLLQAAGSTAALPGERLTLFVPRLAPGQRVFVNGVDVSDRIKMDDRGGAVAFARAADNALNVVIAVSAGGAEALRILHERAADDGNVASVQAISPAGAWKRRLFSGSAQLLVEILGAGTIDARAVGLQNAHLMITGVGK